MVKNVEVMRGRRTAVEALVRSGARMGGDMVMSVCGWFLESFGGVSMRKW